MSRYDDGWRDGERHSDFILGGQLRRVQEEKAELEAANRELRESNTVLVEDVANKRKAFDYALGLQRSAIKGLGQRERVSADEIHRLKVELDEARQAAAKERQLRISAERRATEFDRLEARHGQVQEELRLAQEQLDGALFVAFVLGSKSPRTYPSSDVAAALALKDGGYTVGLEHNAMDDSVSIVLAPADRHTEPWKRS